jgi:tetratricopeptide (TPR) repeat protein
MKGFPCIIVFVLLSALTVEAQTSGPATSMTAMQNYRQGRDMEALNRMGEANAFYNEAIRICLDEVSRNASTRDTYTVMTWTMQRRGRYADVISWGERGLRAFPDEYRIMEMMGEAFFYLDNYEQSLAYMQRYAHAMPEGERIAVAYFFMAEIYRITEKFHYADIAYTTALRIDPRLALWWYRLGSVREAVGDRWPAIQAYQEALRLNPTHREALLAMGRLR